MLALDLDGTTLTRDNQITARDRAAAEALRQAGVHLTIATGRLFTGSQWAAQQLGIDGSIAVMNGSEHVDAASGRVKHGRYLTPAELVKVHQLAHELRVSTFLYESSRIHYGQRDAAHAPYLAIWTEELEEHADVFAADAWQRDLLAVCAVGEQARIDGLTEQLLEVLPDRYGAELFHTFQGERFLKLRDKAEDKGTAIEKLAAERGVTAEETVVIGDWINDVPMLRRAGRSYVMNGAPRDVAEQADAVLDAERGLGGGIAEVASRVWGIEV